MEEEKEIKKDAQKIRTAAASKPKRKQKCSRIVKTCQMCGKTKSCTKRKQSEDLYLCNACTVLVGVIKNNSRIAQKAWEQFGPGDPLLKTLDVTVEAGPQPVEEIDFDRLMDVVSSVEAIRGRLRLTGRVLAPDKEKEIVKLLYRGI